MRDVLITDLGNGLPVIIDLVNGAESAKLRHNFLTVAGFDLLLFFRFIILISCY